MYKKLLFCSIISLLSWREHAFAQKTVNYPIIDMGVASTHRHFNLYKTLLMTDKAATASVPLWSNLDCDCNYNLTQLSNVSGNGGRWDIVHDVARHNQSYALSQNESNVRISNQYIYPIEYPFLKGVLFANSALDDAIGVFKCFTGVSQPKEALVNLNIDYMSTSFIDQVEYILNEVEFPLNKDGKKYETYILQRKDNIDSLFKNTTKNLWLLSIKGGHVLSTGMYLYQDQKDTPEFKKVVLDNVDRLKGLKPIPRPGGKEAIYLKAPIFSMSFDSYFDDGICGKSAKFLPVERDAFLAQDLKSSVSEVGKEVIERLLKRDEKQDRILIDVTGMNVKSRDWYYSLIKEKRYLKDTIPIMAMSVGISGLKATDNDYGNSDDLVKEVPATLLNNRHANLNREDILQIVQSHGLVGLSLERDKLMGVMFKMRYNNTVAGSANRRRVALEAIVGNICKFIQVAQTREAWDMISISTHFDLYGRFLEPYDSTDELPLLAKDLLEFFSNPRAIDGLFTEREIKQFMYNYKAEELVEKIMYKNAYNFIIKNFAQNGKHQGS